jgi:hypothetical protein
MFKLDMKLNGKSVRPNELARKMEKSAMMEARALVERTVADVRCPVHGQQAQLTFVGKTHGKLDWRASVCCENLRAALDAKLK